MRIDQYVRTGEDERSLRYLQDEDDALRSDAFDLELSVAGPYELVL